MTAEDNLAHTVPDMVVYWETDKALLVGESDADPDDKAWIPKSQIFDESEVYTQGTEGDLVIPYWLAERKGKGLRDEVSVLWHLACVPRRAIRRVPERPVRALFGAMVS